MTKEKENEDKKIERFKGERITIGDREFIIPPLNFRQLEDHSESLARLAKLSDSNDPFGDIQRAIPIIHAAISRNYPDMKIEELKDLIDMGNYRSIIEAVMGVSGISDAVRERLSTLGGTKPVPVVSPRPS